MLGHWGAANDLKWHIERALALSASSKARSRVSNHRRDARLHFASAAAVPKHQSLYTVGQLIPIEAHTIGSVAHLNINAGSSCFTTSMFRLLSTRLAAQIAA
jgi:hypothetical protein